MTGPRRGPRSGRSSDSTTRRSNCLDPSTFPIWAAGCRRRSLASALVACLLAFFRLGAACASRPSLSVFAVLLFARPLGRPELLDAPFEPLPRTRPVGQQQVQPGFPAAFSRQHESALHESTLVSLSQFIRNVEYLGFQVQCNVGHLSLQAHF